MTKQLKLSALFVALVASGTAMASEAHTKHGYTVSSQSQETSVTTTANAGKTATSTKLPKAVLNVVIVKQLLPYNKILSMLTRLLPCLLKLCSASTKTTCVLKLKKNWTLWLNA